MWGSARSILCGYTSGISDGLCFREDAKGRNSLVVSWSGDHDTAEAAELLPLQSSYGPDLATARCAIT